MRLFFVTPLAIFLIFVIIMLAKLLGTGNEPPSPLTGKELPEFNLPAIEGAAQGGLSNNDLKGHYSLINIFASWCLTCKVEHPFLMKIKEQKILPIYGINWKDDPEKALRMLKKTGNPFEKIGADKKGELIIQLGVTGAPETFLISPEGIVLYRYAGVLTQSVLNNKILPMVSDE